MRVYFDFFTRKKSTDLVYLEDTKLARVLNTFDLSVLGKNIEFQKSLRKYDYDKICIGIGSTFGSGVYVLLGTVLSSLSGPSVVLSFFVAGIATFLAGLAYAELGSRVPRSGSAYAYIYGYTYDFIHCYTNTYVYICFSYNWRIFGLYNRLGFNLRIYDW